MGSSGSSTSGPGRQVLDRTYYLGRLREKNAELTAEIERLRGSEVAMERGQGGARELEGRVREMESELTRLRDRLSSYSAAADAIKAGKDAEQVRKAAVTAQAESQRARDALDAVYVERKAKEDKARLALEKAAQAEEELTQRLRAAGGTRYADYAKLKAEERQLQAIVEPITAQLDAVTRELAAKHSALKSDPARDGALKLRQRRRELEAKKAAMLDAIAKSDTGMLPDEQTTLLAEVQAATKENQLLARKAEDRRKEIAAMQEAVAALDAELGEFKGERADKYRELESKDREMTDFIDKYDAVRAEQLQQISATEETVVRLLEHISRNLGMRDQVSAPKLAEMQTELGMKREQMERSVTTHERLASELSTKKRELEKISGLDVKIAQELESFKAREKEHQQGLRIVSDIPGLRELYAQRKAKVEAQKEAAVMQREHLGAYVRSALAAVVDAARAEVTKGADAEAVAAGEKRMREKAREVFEMRDFVGSKGAEGDYVPTKMECLKLVDAVGKLVRDAQAKT